MDSLIDRQTARDTGNRCFDGANPCSRPDPNTEWGRFGPYAGITDAPFRRLVERLGAGLVISEMTACAGLVRGEREARVRSEGHGVRIHVVQLAGCEAQWMAEGARIAEAARRRHHRHQHGLPLQAGHKRGGGLGPYARPRQRPGPD